MPATASEIEIKTTPAQLEAFCIAALKKTGVSDADARTTAEVLVTTDTWGVHTHGVKNLRYYIQRLNSGGLNPRGVPKIVSEGPGWARFDGQSSIAMVTSVNAMRCAITKARQCGIAYTGVFNSCHFGAAGYYAAMAAQEGYFAIAMANDGPSMTVPGAKGRVIGNNPIAFAMPRKNGKPIVLDMALSTVAGGKVNAAHALGKPLPEGWVIDVNGNPTTDNAALMQGGSLTPMGGYKGYGLAVVVETLAGVIPGASILAEIPAWVIAVSAPTGHGAAFIALDIRTVANEQTYYARIEEMTGKLHALPTRTPSDRVLLPGEREWEHRDRVLQNGLVLPADVVMTLRGLCDDIGMDLDSLSN
jgi:LDH2 family malate/lactate/ureidoglycolate dehydrogenase